MTLETALAMWDRLPYGPASIPRRIEFTATPADDLVVEVCLTNIVDSNRTDARRMVTFPAGTDYGQVACLECDGTGWWGYGPVKETNGPCIQCKGTGRRWVALS